MSRHAWLTNNELSTGSKPNNSVCVLQCELADDEAERCCATGDGDLVECASCDGEVVVNVEEPVVVVAVLDAVVGVFVVGSG